MSDPVLPVANARKDVRLRVARWLLAATIGGSALALGSLHTLTLCVVTAALAAAAFFAWYDAEPFRARPAASALLCVGGALTLWTLVQAIPLPVGVLRAIAPATADVWSRCLSPLKEAGPEWATISLDPIATRIQVLRGVAYLLALLTTLRVAHKQEGTIFLERALVASGALMALVALLHPAFGATRVFGVYQPLNGYAWVPRHIGPLLNANHLSGYLVMGASVALGIVVSPRAGSSRALCAAVVLLAIGTQLWAASRGGTLGMLLALVLVPAVTWMAQRTQRRVIATAMVPALLAIAGIAVAILASFDYAWQDLSSTDVSKAQLWKQALGLVRMSPFLGIGRGAFEAAFPALRQGRGYFVFTHPENVIVQWMCEWGVPVAVAAGLAVLAALRPSSLLARSRPPIGAWAALACLFVHNLVDFTSEVPGVMIALVVCAGMVVSGSAASPNGSESARRSWILVPSPRAAGVGAAVVLAALAFALSTLGIDLNNEQFALHDRALDPQTSREQFHTAARAAMLRHPADPYLPFVGAVRAARAADESVVPWAGRALERSPVYGRAHLLLARSFSSRSPSQARLEYRLAITDEPFLTSYVVTEGPRLVHSFDDAISLIPPAPGGLESLEGLALALSPRLPATSVRLDAEVSARDPHAMGPVRRALDDIVLAIAQEDASPWCGEGSRACIDRGLSLAGRLIDAEKTKCAGYAYRARLKLARGEGTPALDELGDATAYVEDPTACNRQLIAMAMEGHDDGRVDRVIDRVARAGCPVDGSCADNWAYLARIEETRGNLRRALAFYKKGYEVAADREDLLADAARVAGSLGLHAEAFQAYTHLAQAKPAEPRWAELAAAEKAALNRVPPTRTR